MILSTEQEQALSTARCGPQMKIDQWKKPRHLSDLMLWNFYLLNCEIAPMYHISNPSWIDLKKSSHEE